MKRCAPSDSSLLKRNGRHILGLIVTLVSLITSSTDESAFAEASAESQTSARRIALLLIATGELEQELGDNLTEVLIAAVAEQTNAHIVGAEEFRAQLRIEDEESIRCLESPTCLGRVGVQLGVSEVISGIVGTRPGGYAHMIIRTDVASGEVRSRVYRELEGGLTELTQSVHDAAPQLLEDGEDTEDDTEDDSGDEDSVLRQALTSRFRRQGMLLELSIGVSGVTSEDYLEELVNQDVDVSPLIGFPAVAIFYRPIPWVAAGILFQHTFINASSEDLDQKGIGLLTAALGVRGSLPFRRFEPWIGLGVGYSFAYSSATGAWFWGEGEGDFELHGVGLDITAGLSVHVTERIIVGIFLRFVTNFWIQGCLNISGDIIGIHSRSERCADIDEIYQTELTPQRDDVPSELPHLWHIGLSLGYQLF